MGVRTLAMILRVLFVVQLVLGILFWLDVAGGGWVVAHMLVGILFVALFWAIGIVGAWPNGNLGLAAGTFFLGLVLAIVGMTQTGILTGSGHWIIQVIHLLLAVLCLGMAEMISGRARRAKVA